LTNDLSVWITPIAVTAFLLVACAVGGKVAGFMCGLPYTSAPMLYAIAAQHGNAGAIAATRSAIGIKLVFIAAAVIFIYQYGVGTSRITRSVKTSSRPNVGTVFGVGAFALAVLTCSPCSVPIFFPRYPSILENGGYEKEQIHRRADHWFH
jgi:hypothetical protein